jgi:hypothetical protein
MTTEQIPTLRNNSFGEKWKIEIGIMEKRKHTRAFLTVGVTPSIFILTDFRRF